MNKHVDPNASVGMRVRIISMNDDYNPIDTQMEGTISYIDDIGTLHVSWDDGRTLGVIPGVDEYQLLPPENEQVGIEIFEENSANSLPNRYELTFKSELNKTKPKVKLESDDAIKGGIADKLSIQDIAKKHKVPIGDIRKEIKKGTPIELEHTKDRVLAKEIVMDHLTEFPDFYSNEKHGAIASEKGLKKIHEDGGMTLKGEVQRILSTIKTAQYQHKDTVETMINNFYKKHKGRVSDVDKLTKIYTNLLDKLESKFNVDETSTGGGVSTGAFIGPLGGKDETLIKKPFTKQIGKEITGKKSISNPTGKIYTVAKKTEAKIISKKDLISEVNRVNKLRDGGGGFDGDAWVGDEKGWERRNELAWEGGDISDILAKMDINWTDHDLSLTDKQTDKINEGEKKKTKESPIHKKKWERCVKDVKKQNKKDGKDYNPYAVCTASIGYEGSIKKPHRRKEEEIEEATTYSSVMGVNGPPVGVTFAAPNGKHGPSKKPIWKGGTIVQDIKSDGVLVAEMSHSPGTSDKFKSSVIELLKIKHELKDLKFNFTIKKDALKVMSLGLQISYDGNTRVYKIIDSSNGKEYYNTIQNSKCKDCKFREHKDVIKFIKSKKIEDEKKKKKMDRRSGVNVKEENTVKYVEGGKYVKLKDKCVKFNNQPWCDSGNASDPLQLSDTTMGSIDNISEIYGISKETILDKIKTRLNSSN